MNNKKNNNEIIMHQSGNKSEIVFYQPDKSLSIEVLLENETVWLTQTQIAQLFGTETPAISKHINNIYKVGELDKISTLSILEIVQQEGNRSIKRKTAHYNLDMILSVGYRVNSVNATLFRRWATKILKEYLLKGYAINNRIERVEKFAIKTEKRVTETEKKIDFLIKTSLPLSEGILYDGQTFDAYVFVADLIKSAKKSITLIDNYIDESILLLLSKRANKVEATIYTSQITNQLRLDLQRHNTQYPPITVNVFTRSHDRFLLIDNVVYHFGASLKDMGKKWFAFSKMVQDAQTLLQNII
jgi:prophage antirepressor-like protein